MSDASSAAANRPELASRQASRMVRRACLVRVEVTAAPEAALIGSAHGRARIFARRLQAAVVTSL